MATTWYDSKIIRISEESPNTRRFWLKIEGVDSFPFRAGQFVTMDLPIGEKRQQRWRSYSIANAPDGSNVLEFCIVHLDGGLATTYFFEEAALGTPVRFKGPDGNFVLPDPIPHDLILVCTGTGVAPFRSMVWDVFNQKKAYNKIHLIFGTRTADGVLYQSEFESLAQQMPGFRYSVTLSREEKPGFHHGYVHACYLHEYAEKRPDVTFLLCGWSEMVDEAVANLIVKLGYDRSQVKYELYG